jgi:hypothetical protein
VLAPVTSGLSCRLFGLAVGPSSVSLQHLEGESELGSWCENEHGSAGLMILTGEAGANSVMSGNFCLHHQICRRLKCRGGCGGEELPPVLPCFMQAVLPKVRSGDFVSAISPQNPLVAMLRKKCRMAAAD